MAPLPPIEHGTDAAPGLSEEEHERIARIGGAVREEGKQVHAVHFRPGGRTDPRGAQDGRNEVDLLRDHFALAGLEERSADHERDTHHLLVRRAVVLAAVLAELLTVVGREDDDGPVGHPARGQFVQQPADVTVRVGDLLIVAVAVAVAE